MRYASFHPLAVLRDYRKLCNLTGRFNSARANCVTFFGHNGYMRTVLIRGIKSVPFENSLLHNESVAAYGLKLRPAGLSVICADSSILLCQIENTACQEPAQQLRARTCAKCVATGGTEFADTAKTTELICRYLQRTTIGEHDIGPFGFTVCELRHTVD